MDLIYLIKVLQRKIWIIVLVPIIAAVAAYAFTLNMERKYKSTAQLSTGFTTTDRVQITKENFDYWQSKANFENLIETLKSGIIGSMVSYDLLLHDLNEKAPFRKMDEITQQDSIRKKLETNLASFKLLSSYDPFENKILKILEQKRYDFAKWTKKGDLVVERIKDTDFIKIEFLSENPFLSAFVVNKLCDEYIRYNSLIKDTFTEESLQFFANEVNKKKEELDEKTQQLNHYKSDNQVYNYDRESDSKVNQVSEYELQLQKEENKANGLSLALKSIEARIANYGKNSASTNNTKLLELRKKINELVQIYTDDGSKDKELATTIQGLRNQLQEEISKAEERSDPNNRKPKSLDELNDEKEATALEYQIASANVTSIQGKINGLKGNVSRIGSKESALASLDRERENAFKDYTTATDKFNEAKSKSLITGNNVKVMIKGQPNGEPESSKTLIIIALAFLGCGALCVGTIIMIEFFDYTLKTPDKFTSFSKLNMMGYIYQVDPKKMEPGFVFKQKSDIEEVETVKHFLRKIRFVLVNTGKRVILVSSTKTGEGKTFSIISLVHSLSLLNKKILIIDTNFKHNSLTRIMLARPMLQRGNERKLLNAGPIQPSPIDEEFSKGIISHTTDKNVDIIGSSEGYESPSEIFAGRDFSGMLETLKQTYDYIFMEGASLNDYSDTKELIQFADGVVAVFSAKSSLRQSDRESIKYLKSLNGKFIGAILNSVDKNDIKI